MSDGSAVVVATVHHRYVDDSVPFSLRLHLNLYQRHPHIPIVEHARLADASLLQLLVDSLQCFLGSEADVVDILLDQQEVDVGVLDP